MLSHIEEKIINNYLSNKKTRKNMSSFKKNNNNSDNALQIKPNS